MAVSTTGSFLALSGGVGGAKLALGLSKQLPPGRLTIIANTADDFEHLGLTICPDLDTMLYTLAGWNNNELGWGQADESWRFLEALSRLDGETWFNLGDRDLATHILRTGLLRGGGTLSDVTRHLCGKMGITHRVLPMSDQTISTRVHLKDGGSLSFQHYFVRDKCQPVVTGFEFSGIENSEPSPGFQKALDARPTAIIVCPSNPFVSVAPILALPGVQGRIRELGVPVIAVSNIVGGMAIKGPAAKMMAELGMPQTALGVAEHYVEKYGGLITGFVLDERDADLEPAVRALGLSTIVTNTVMVTLRDRTGLAARLLEFASHGVHEP